MKKILSLVFLSGASFLTFAQTQVPNADFENWSEVKPAYAFYAPDKWNSGANCGSVGNGTESCQFLIGRTTDAQSGKYALKHFDSNPTGSHVNYGTYGNFDDNFSSPAFSGRPTSATFYYKYTTDDKQEMNVSFLLYTGSLVGTNEQIGAAKFTFSEPVNSYQKVTINFTYLTSSTPTNILITSDYTSHPATALDTLTLDNFVFNYGTATDVTNPNSPDYFSLVVSNKNITTSKTISNAVIVDLTGRKVVSFNDESENFNVSQLKTGIYIFTGMVNSTPFTRKVLIE
jgi:hypothetical protein